MTDELMDDAEHRMLGAIEALDRDLAAFRTGRASTALVDRLTVDYYGAPTPLQQMATIATPEPRLITIRPWDPSVLPKIEKAIMASNLGLTPNSDGQVIRLNIPPLTEERREELVRLVAKRVEEARVAVRNVRRDLMKHLESSDLPEDVLHRTEKRAQEMTDQYVHEAEAHGERKTAEIREV